MALDANVMGSAIAATIQSFKPAAGAKVTESQLEQMWQAVSADIINHFKANLDIEFSAADIPVPGLGLLDSTGGAVTGQAENAPTGPLNGKIS